uniref:Uncharacterized protein n=1 Tax=viral metagenome TaxID=1070528 RepID=A0A6C0H753_9ZZZZ
MIERIFYNKLKKNIDNFDIFITINNITHNIIYNNHCNLFYLIIKTNDIVNIIVDLNNEFLITSVFYMLFIDDMLSFEKKYFINVTLFIDYFTFTKSLNNINYNIIYINNKINKKIIIQNDFLNLTIKHFDIHYLFDNFMKIITILFNNHYLIIVKELLLNNRIISDFTFTVILNNISYNISFFHHLNKKNIIFYSNNTEPSAIYICEEYTNILIDKFISIVKKLNNKTKIL